MKMFIIPCDVNGAKVPVQMYIGEPTPHVHPIKYQSTWLAAVRNVHVPSDVMDSLQKLADIALENNVSFVDLCTYALNYPAGESKSEAGASEGTNS